jgi:2-polyprenyl-3-methyl-5-hydroxy-6-metoxy-1,4-benzoquinol methylase
MPKVTKVLGVDISPPKAIDFANKYFFKTDKNSFCKWTLELNFKDNYFDVVVSFDVLEHLGEKDQPQCKSQSKK